MTSQEQQLRILVVDDDDVSRTVLHDHLSAAGHHVFPAPDVAGAKAVLKRESVQIVVADWIMPGASGLDLCEWVRHQPWGLSLHFVMLTVLSEKAKLIEAFRCGVDDFLSKPLHEGELFARLTAWGRIVSLRRQLSEQHAEALRANEELRMLNAKLGELAIRDELTGLPNRREAVRRLQEQWLIAARHEQPLCCAVLDVDHFKEVNDSCGHGAGDEVLKQLAERFTQCVRNTDVVFRIGGDEFLVLLPFMRTGDAVAWAQRCRNSVSDRPFTVAGAELHLTVTVGVADRTATTRDWREMVERADHALLVGKRCGRNGVQSPSQNRLLIKSVE